MKKRSTKRTDFGRRFNAGWKVHPSQVTYAFRTSLGAAKALFKGDLVAIGPDGRLVFPGEP